MMQRTTEDARALEANEGLASPERRKLLVGAFGAAVATSAVPRLFGGVAQGNEVGSAKARVAAGQPLNIDGAAEIAKPVAFADIKKESHLRYSQRESVLRADFSEIRNHINVALNAERFAGGILFLLPAASVILNGFSLTDAKTGQIIDAPVVRGDFGNNALLIKADSWDEFKDRVITLRTRFTQVAPDVPSALRLAEQRKLNRPVALEEKDITSLGYDTLATNPNFIPQHKWYEPHLAGALVELGYKLGGPKWDNASTVEKILFLANKYGPSIGTNGPAPDWRAPDRVEKLVRGSHGVCSERTLAFRAILSINNIPARWISGLRSNSQIPHGWIEAYSSELNAPIPVDFTGWRGSAERTINGTFENLYYPCTAGYKVGYDIGDVKTGRGLTSNPLRMLYRNYGNAAKPDAVPLGQVKVAVTVL